MDWRIEFDRSAEKELDQLDTQSSTRILRFLLERIAPSDDPRSFEEALKGNRFRNLWKYRVGDHRIIVRIDDGDRRIIVARIGNRREIYRR